MFNKKLKEELEELKEENEKLNRENEQLRTAYEQQSIKLEETRKSLRVHMPQLHKLQKECSVLGIENDNRKRTLSKVRKGKKIKPEELEKLTLHRSEFRKDGYCIEHWIIPVMPEGSEAQDALEWWERGGKKEWESEVQRIYFQPNVGWVLVRKYQKNFPVISPS